MTLPSSLRRPWHIAHGALLISLLALALSTRPAAAGEQSGEAELPKSLQCSFYDAEYKPHPSYAKRNLDFALTIERSPGMNLGARGPLFYFDAYDRKTSTMLSTLRLAMTCANGSGGCDINAYWGQFNPPDRLAELPHPMRFNIVALDPDLSSGNLIPSDKGSAPYALILPATAAQLVYNGINRPKDWNTFLRFHTPERVFPNFGGYDIWILSSCRSAKDRRHRTEE